MVFINSSGILPWKKENIDNVPVIRGVYILRSGTSIESILYIGKAGLGRMKERLLEHFNSNDIPRVNFFDWYETRTEDDATTLESFWINKYSPPYNTR